MNKDYEKIKQFNKIKNNHYLQNLEYYKRILDKKSLIELEKLEKKYNSLYFEVKRILQTKINILISERGYQKKEKTVAKRININGFVEYEKEFYYI